MIRGQWGGSVLTLGQDICCFLTCMPGELASTHLRLLLLLPPFFLQECWSYRCLQVIAGLYVGSGIHTPVLTLGQQVIFTPEAIPSALLWILHHFMDKI